MLKSDFKKAITLINWIFLKFLNNLCMKKCPCRQDKTYFSLEWFLNRNDYTGETSHNRKLSLAEGILGAKALRQEYPCLMFVAKCDFYSFYPASRLEGEAPKLGQSPVSMWGRSGVFADSPHLPNFLLYKITNALIF